MFCLEGTLSPVKLSPNCRGHKIHFFWYFCSQTIWRWLNFMCLIFCPLIRGQSATIQFSLVSIHSRTCSAPSSVVSETKTIKESLTKSYNGWRRCNTSWVLHNFGPFINLCNLSNTLWIISHCMQLKRRLFLCLRLEHKLLALIKTPETSLVLKSLHLNGPFQIDLSRVCPTCALIWNLVPSFESCRVHVPAAFHRLWENFENWFSFSPLCISYFLFIVFHRLWENCANWFSRFCILYFIGSEKTLQTDFLVLLCVYCV